MEQVKNRVWKAFYFNYFMENYFNYIIIFIDYKSIIKIINKMQKQIKKVVPNLEVNPIFITN